MKKNTCVEGAYVSIDFMDFFVQLASNPTLVVITLLTIGVIVVNGATDAPNAIATVVATRSLSPNAAIIMAAVCNFLGLLLVTLVSSAVATTIFKMVDFGTDSQAALIAVMAAMVAIIVWGAGAWIFGLPTSQSHSLIAGLTGAAIAIHGGFDGINGAEWMKVIYGILLSTFFGFGFGWLISKIVVRVFRRADRRKSDRFFKWAQVAAGAGVAFMHGAQDGQKFMGIFMISISLALGVGQESSMAIPLWMMLACALTMGIGTAAGGKKIIKSVGMDMVKLDKYQGFAASFSGTISLIIATFGGLPVSTTHTNTTAIMGVGAAKRKSAVKWGVAFDMVKTWVLTFPACGLIAFLMAKLFLFIMVPA